MIQRKDALIGEEGNDVICLMGAEGPSGPGAKGRSSAALWGGAHGKGGLPPLHFPYPKDLQ
jgi:hypothetical protein